MFPTISLTGSAGYASTDLKDLFKSAGFSWSVGPSIDLPIFDWGTPTVNIKISETEQQIAIADYDKAIPSAFREVNDAVAARAHIDEHLAAQRRLVIATDTTYKLSTTRFRAGIDMPSFLTQKHIFQHGFGDIKRTRIAYKESAIFPFYWIGK